MKYDVEFRCRFSKVSGVSNEVLLVEISQTTPFYGASSIFKDEKTPFGLLIY